MTAETPSEKANREHWNALINTMINNFCARDFGRQPRIPHAERLALSGAISQVK